MKKLLVFTLTGLLLATKAVAQIPYFAATVGNGKLYGYSSLKTCPGVNEQTTYTCFQYGLGDHFATGIDISTTPDCTYWGTLVRYGTGFSKWFNVGIQATPAFNLSNNFHFAHLRSALYLNGAITTDSRLFWSTNTYWGVNDSDDNTLTNYEYMGYTIPFRNGQSLTPMIGAIHSWKFDNNVDLAFGCYYTIKNWNFYLWGNDILKSHPHLTIGIDFGL